VVARDNFGPRVAQIAAVALLIDYTVTVAVQVSAGSAALVTMVPRLGRFDLYITVLVVLILVYGNLRGLREAAVTSPSRRISTSSCCPRPSWWATTRSSRERCT